MNFALRRLFRKGPPPQAEVEKFLSDNEFPLVDGSDVFTGDTLFKGPMGGVRAPGHTTYEDLRESIMERLMKLDPEGSEECTALGEPATLILLGDDYDGGHKAWVRWPDGRDDIVPGSQVQRGG